MCLGRGDWAVEHLSLPCADISDSVRAYRFALATAVGFVVANLVCWVLNRMFVFKPGKFRWYIELALFFGVSLSATLIALAISSVMIHMLGLMTTIALVVEIVVSFMMNYFIRKFFIFKG
jgi:putative flippase GtrA